MYPISYPSRFPYDRSGSVYYFDWKPCPNCQADYDLSNGDVCPRCGRLIERVRYQRDTESLYQFGDLNLLIESLLNVLFSEELKNKNIELTKSRADDPQGFQFIWIRFNRKYISIEWKEHEKIFGISIWEKGQEGTPFDPPDEYHTTESLICRIVETALKNEFRHV